ncbi:MAG: peptide-methionine (S)-S-oxide reductase MsrA [Alphaproteobacteria bacterium]|nr:peptide-methionine (S)-S-oxide reductase MsrA [Alphaproteobacteria bacterium]
MNDIKKTLMAALFGSVVCSSSAHAVTLPPPAYDETPAKAGQPVAPQTIVVAGGCFWGIQAVFQHMKGVTKAISGYAGGKADEAHYNIVGSGATGHAESVQVTYDPSQTSLGKILMVYFAVAHDPTELNRQGPDHGTQYRSTIFYASPEQKKIAADYIAQLDEGKHFSVPIVTTLEPLQTFYPAEDYHQDYARLHPDSPYIIVNDAPKVRAFASTYPDLYTQP